MDSTEPEMVDGPFKTPRAQIDANETHMTPTRLGSGARMLNAFSLVNSQAIYEGMRASAPDQRVLILTRNGFAGQQRYGAVSWSGDISSTWTALRKQIPAGLGFSISGIPYWTVDTGGFSVPYRFANDRPAPADLDEWRELATRWFEYSTFLPILRSHGQSPYREMWQYGGETSPAFQAQLKFDRLRYRLLPYIYSVAARVTSDGGTMLRPLVMDFPDDQRARTIGDQYLFGPALLVSPISAYRQRARPVYLPADDSARRTAGTTSGPARLAGAGAVVDAAAPYDAIPVHVRAGSILPLGPELQFAAEKPADPITLMIYEGADGHFTIYEDDGTSYQYERGQSARIPIAWNQAARTLTHRRARGVVPRHAGAPPLRDRRRAPRPAGPLLFRAHRRSHRRVRWRGAVDRAAAPPLTPSQPDPRRFPCVAVGSRLSARRSAPHVAAACHFEPSARPSRRRALARPPCPRRARSPRPAKPAETPAREDDARPRRSPSPSSAARNGARRGRRSISTTSARSTATAAPTPSSNRRPRASGAWSSSAIRSRTCGASRVRSPGKGYLNRGIGGQTTAQMLVRFREDVIALAPLAVVILAGTNDIAGNSGPMTLEETEANFTSMAELARLHGIRVIFSSILPVHHYTARSDATFPLRPPEKIAELNRWLRSYCAANGHTYLDYVPATADEKGWLKRELAEDGLHPGPAGYALMAALAQAAIDKTLGVAPSASNDGPRK